jgi:hypothetical protein
VKTTIARHTIVAGSRTTPVPAKERTRALSYPDLSRYTCLKIDESSEEIAMAEEEKGQKPGDQQISVQNDPLQGTGG